MTSPNFGFYFETAGRGASQGAISPAEQFFEGSLAESSLVRETAQNSIDARLGDETVKMVFELKAMETADVPGIEGLRATLKQVAEETRGAQGHANMKLAYDTAMQEHIEVLRISDYGTKGLTGSESMDNPTSALSALTRGAGISADDGSRGGSFGIGSAVGPMASNMSTVLYTSRPHNQPSVVFAGYSCLASHRDGDGKWHVGDGFFTDLTCMEDFSYLRDPGALGPFPERTAPGTDVYILGYRKAGADPDLRHIKVALMRNFLLAIDRGNLVVDGITADCTWTLDSNTLDTSVLEDSEAHAFYRAIKDEEPIVGASDQLGSLSLYINVDDSLDKSLHTITVRKPLMKIDTFRHNSIPIKYAAVLECSDDEGNKLLRALEPPQHHRWDPERAPHGKAIIKELKNFVREGLKSRVKQHFGDQIEVKGLARYLPMEVFEDKSHLLGSTGTPINGQGTKTESSTIRGTDGGSESVQVRSSGSFKVGVSTSAAGDGETPAKKGKDAGGSSSRTNSGGDLEGTGSLGDGSGRITAGDVRFRSWCEGGTGDLCLSITAAESIEGDLELVPLGPGGSMEDGFVLPIKGGTVSTGSTHVALKNKGNVLSNLKLEAGVTSHIRLKLSSPHRYRLGIK
ncbi:hypothetical protein NNX28_12860 [Arthrobacter sp. zg-Y859]|uniref:Uncharacterized protein n=1 Tax=Arthrobacter jinronghuae TaxID=2964609 RepID=A0ABT1NSU8_9MICC|nr:hypothetical protein [Arthrobacter jinronghuae]MCQ1950812.1 hypothetical protein [Arthrobacter jinronghuae]UWX79280.1 hypothetical protein N2K98_03450 [Arthrobacter jinronghuae]